jgi:hypothetical protein
LVPSDSPLALSQATDPQMHLPYILICALQLLRVPYKGLKILPRILLIRSFCYGKATQNRFLIDTSCFFYISSPCKSTPKVAADFISEDELYEQRNVDTSTNETGIISGIAMNLDW